MASSSSKKELNILLLGETGVGKSTFINAFLNYLSYDSLDEAEKSQLICAIPSKFSVMDDNFEPKEISIGQDKNENFKTGQSATQSTKAHVFYFEQRGFTLRLIDTPGIGDTRGIDQDKKNLENLLNYIANYQQIDAVCILLKPNNSRLGVAFRYVLKELLSNLHKGAAKNIVFCFTNSRSTFYKPGDTLPTLRTLLDDLKKDSKVEIQSNKDNIFCFDNESFRFLAALTHKIQFDDKDKENFSISWEKSVEVSWKMIEYINNLPKHQVNETLSLNKARRVIMELSKPIAEISQTIQMNIKIANEKLAEIKHLTDNTQDLEKKLNLTQLDIKATRLDYPRTVCTSAKCTQLINFNGTQKIDYKTACHDPCSLKGVTVDTIAHPELIRCSAMTDGICQVCGCNWQSHMHITYKTKQVETTVIDLNVQNSIDDQRSKTDKIIAFKNNIENRIKDLDKEQKTLMETSAKFAHFLKKNAICAFNDDIEKFLDLLIDEEHKKNTLCPGNRQTLYGLEKSKLEYQKQKKIFDDAAQNGDQTKEIKVDDIDKLISQLYDLPINGPNLKNIMDTVHGNNKNPIEFIEQTQKIKERRRWFW